jgi:phosphoribosylglycinamide formyltransferase 1
MKKVVLFASGSGTNAENIISYLKKGSQGNVVALFTNNPNAKVLERVKKFDIPSVIFSKEELIGQNVLLKLNAFRPDLIVLAGFLLQFPKNIIDAYSNKIINIHPALLPKYGGKGMYGINVHKAVLENKEPETGITIHYVNENYDEGKFIFQKNVNIQDCITSEEVAQKVHHLEQEFFPQIIETLLTNLPLSKTQGNKI